MKNKKIIALFALFGLLAGIAPVRANAAGAMRFDYENAGVSQESQYVLPMGSGICPAQKLMNTMIMAV